MATTLKQIQAQKQKLAPRQVLQARLLQLNTMNLEQAIIEELEKNPLLEQVEPEDFQDNEDTADETSMEDIPEQRHCGGRCGRGRYFGGAFGDH